MILRVNHWCIWLHLIPCESTPNTLPNQLVTFGWLLPNDQMETAYSGGRLNSCTAEPPRSQHFPNPMTPRKPELVRWTSPKVPGHTSNVDAFANDSMYLDTLLPKLRNTAWRSPARSNWVIDWEASSCSWYDFAETWKFKQGRMLVLLVTSRWVRIACAAELQTPSVPDHF